MRNIHYSTLRQGLKKPLLPLRQQFDALKKQVLSFPDGRILFDIPVVIDLFACFGAWADAHRGVWLMDGNGQWYELNHHDANAAELIAGISQKIKSLSHERSKILSEC